jgi:hypothetical protein
MSGWLGGTDHALCMPDVSAMVAWVGHCTRHGLCKRLAAGTSHAYLRVTGKSDTCSCLLPVLRGVLRKVGPKFRSSDLR